MPKKAGLEYEAQQPAFLRRLRAGQSELDGRHNVQIPRARGGIGKNSRLDMHGEEGDDDPVMLDEEGNVVSKEDMKKLEQKADEKEGEGDRTSELEEPGNFEKEDQAEKMLTGANVSSGFSKKRKSARVIGNDDESLEPGKNDANDEVAPSKSLKQSTKDFESAVYKQKDEYKKETSGAATKKGKRKKVKLSFDDPE